MQSIFDLIFPKRCVGCDRILAKNQDFLCVSCFRNLSFTHWQIDEETPLFQNLNRPDLFQGAQSFFYYDKGGTVQALLHANKYFNQPKIGKFIAQLLPKDLIEFYKTKNIDAVIAVPSHPRTLRQRGYNQVHAFAQEVSNQINANFSPRLLVRSERKSSQTQLGKSDRFSRLDGAFSLNKNPNLGDFQRVLLIDDLATTGSTLIHCAEVLKQNYPKIEIFVLTMAHARS
ncbi:ComF family protein [Ornithobacterium rhinotracheale]